MITCPECGGDRYFEWIEDWCVDGEHCQSVTRTPCETCDGKGEVEPTCSGCGEEVQAVKLNEEGFGYCQECYDAAVADYERSSDEAVRDEMPGVKR